MIIKQYAVTLPADYDMKIIRDRVAKKGPAFDHFPGLGIKVFMIREKGHFGAESNQYAPVYLWPSVAPIWDFVAGDGFKGILESFGWTAINYWLGLAYARRRDLAWTDLRSVSREEASISPGTNLVALRAQEIQAARKAVVQDVGPVASAVGVDTDAWSLVRFNYWTVAQDALPRGSRSYEVLHVSAAAPDSLTET